MASPYKRRKPSIIRNLWVYRRLVLAAVVLGMLLWFIWANSGEVVVSFPFGLGKRTSTTGLIILTSTLVGSVATFLVMTVYLTFRSRRHAHHADEPETKPLADDELPPPDYAAKTGEGIARSPWP